MNEKQLRELLADEEDYGLEFKAARTAYGKGNVHDYCAALANENGGYLLLGINNERLITGTQAFAGNWNKLAHELTNNLQIRVKVFNISTSEARVLAFHVPRHAAGSPVQVRGGTGKYRYPIRNGESLEEMDTATLQNIFAERDSDWSASIIKGATFGDLDTNALINFRTRWSEHTKKPEYLQLAFKKILHDLQLMDGDRVTSAALLLFGGEGAMMRFLPDAEVIFEWRNNERDIAYGERKNWRAGFMLIQDDIWNTINARNTIFRYQEGFVQHDIPAFDEESIREAVINAFVHRDYRIHGRSIIIKASPERFYIENPGRLMPGVTLENIFDRSEWRNRLLAESLEKASLMERSSQGIDKIFRHSIESGKGLPVLEVTHDPTVLLNMPATLQDQAFVNYLQAVTNKHQVTLSLKEIIELEQIRQGTKISNLTHRDRFLELGMIEKIGQGRGTKYILAHQYYKQADAVGRHTRLAGLPREVKRNIILEHLKKNQRITNRDLQLAMPDMTMREISRMFRSMEADGLIEHVGARKYGYWRAKAN